MNKGCGDDWFGYKCGDLTAHEEDGVHLCSECRKEEDAKCDVHVQEKKDDR